MCGVVHPYKPTSQRLFTWPRLAGDKGRPAERVARFVPGRAGTDDACAIGSRFDRGNPKLLDSARPTSDFEIEGVAVLVETDASPNVEGRFDFPAR